MEMRICVCLLSVSHLTQAAVGPGSAPLAKCGAAGVHRAKWLLKEQRRWFSARASAVGQVCLLRQMSGRACSSAVCSQAPWKQV